MSLPIITNTYRVAVRGVCPSGQPWVNVLHFQKPGGSTYTAFKTALATSLNNIYTAGGVAGAGTSGWATLGGSAARVVDYVITPLDGVSVSDIIALSINGAATGDALPSDTALVFTLRTGTRGRSFRGRTFWAGATEVNNDSTGHVFITNLAEFVANWNAVIASTENATAILSVASYLLAFATPVLNVTGNNVWNRQHRRAA